MNSILLSRTLPVLVKQGRVRVKNGAYCLVDLLRVSGILDEYQKLVSIPSPKLPDALENSSASKHVKAAAVLARTGILEFAFSQVTYTNESRAVTTVHENCLANASTIWLTLELNIKADDTPVTTVNKLLKRIGPAPKKVKRAGSDGDRAYIYEVQLPEGLEASAKTGVYTSESPEAIALHERCLPYRQLIANYLGLKIAEDHTPVTTVNKLLKRLGFHAQKGSLRGAAGAQRFYEWAIAADDALTVAMLEGAIAWDSYTVPNFDASSFSFKGDPVTLWWILSRKDKKLANLPLENFGGTLSPALRKDQVSNYFLASPLFFPASVCAVKKARGGKRDRPSQQLEAQLERALASRLIKCGTEVNTQVHCSAGRADIVTPDTVIEVKNINRWREAPTQAVSYSLVLGKQYREVVLFGECDPNTAAKIFLTCDSIGVGCSIYDTTNGDYEAFIAGRISQPTYSNDLASLFRSTLI